MENFKCIERNESDKSFIFHCEIDGLVWKLEALNRATHKNFDKYVFFFSDIHEYERIEKEMESTESYRRDLDDRLRYWKSWLNVKNNIFYCDLMATNMTKQMINLSYFINSRPFTSFDRNLSFFEKKGNNSSGRDILFFGTCPDNPMMGYYMLRSHRSNASIPKCVVMRRLIEYMDLPKLLKACSVLLAKHGITGRVKNLLEESSLCLCNMDDAELNLDRQFVIWELDKHAYRIDIGDYTTGLDLPNLNLGSKKIFDLQGCNFDNLLLCIERDARSVIVKSETKNFCTEHWQSDPNFFIVPDSIDVSSGDPDVMINEIFRDVSRVIKIDPVKKLVRKMDKETSMDVVMSMHEDKKENDTMCADIYKIIVKANAISTAKTFFLGTDFTLKERHLRWVLWIAIREDFDGNLMLYSSRDKILGTLNKCGVSITCCNPQLDLKFDCVIESFKDHNDWNRITMLHVVRNVIARLRPYGHLALHFKNKELGIQYARRLKSSIAQIHKAGLKFSFMHNEDDMTFLMMRRKSKFAFGIFRLP